MMFSRTPKSHHFLEIFFGFDAIIENLNAGARDTTLPLNPSFLVSSLILLFPL